MNSSYKKNISKELENRMRDYNVQINLMKVQWEQIEQREALFE